MVFIQYKKSQKNSFTIECPLETLVSELLQKIIEVNNIRIYLDRLIWSVQQLANKGVLKPMELQGVSWEDYQKNQKQFSTLPSDIKQYGVKPVVEAPYKYVPDKHNQRYGLILPAELSKLLLLAVESAKEVMKPKKDSINKLEYVDAIEKLREAVMNCFPAYIGLPQWEPTLLLLEEKLELEILESEHFQLYDKNSSIWWAGKQLDKHMPLLHYAGKNEKTKIIVKVQKFGGEQPLREPPVDAETYQKMVKFYYKKVQESKQFDKKSVQTYYDKVETKSLKAKLHLEDEEIRFKPF